MNKIVDDILKSDAISSLISNTDREYIFEQLGFKSNSSVGTDEVCRLVFFLSNTVFNTNEAESTTNAQIAYNLLKTINISDPNNVNVFNKVFGIDDVDTTSLYYFYLSNLALKANQLISIRIDLKKYNLILESDNWKIRLINKTLEAFLLLVRKQNGFADIKNALTIIEDLKKQQNDYEKRYLNTFSIANQVGEAYSLLAGYHLTKALVETATYLIEGYDYKGGRIDAIIRQHLDIAKKLSSDNARLVSMFDLFEFGFKSLANNAIWNRTAKLNDKIKNLCQNKAKSGLIELLPSQRKALDDNLLNVGANAIVLQMPTSAGKTLMAEFNILITKSLQPNAKIVYIVPSRALVNQVYYDLKNDLEPLDLCIEKTSSAIEIDPVENNFLCGGDNIDILVSTPEKLDLLIRRQHPSVQDVSLFVLDEAHTIQNGERGAKLELLMAILRRERPNAKYMLLSPFIKNAGQILTEWLGGGNSIVADWKPSVKLIFGLDIKKTTRKNDCTIEILSTPYDTVMSIGEKTIPNPSIITSPKGKKQILETAIKHFAEPGKTFLTLCNGKNMANTRANFIYEIIDDCCIDDDVKLVQKYIEDEVGSPTTLSKVLSKGIATHHAGMSDETRLLVEHLIRERKIQYVCATTTIAEGVNFPVSTVYFDDFRKGNVDLNANDFWNIAGRAGRTLVDNYGKIILPFNSQANKIKAKELIKNSANELVSVLADLFDNADLIDKYLQDNDNLSGLLQNHNDSLAPLIQYFVHLLTVGDDSYYVTEIEDLFKDSLEYYLLDTEDKKSKFINICKSIYLFLENQNRQNEGILSFADKTGFSVPSVLKIMQGAKNNPDLLHINDWNKDNVFNTNDATNLSEKISVIAKLKETKLGIENSAQPFNPELYAKMIISWVKGDKYNSIANIHPAFNISAQNDDTREKIITEFVKKMNDIRFKASWGLSALEGIIQGNETEIHDSLIPSLVYFGVDNDKSLALRMIGIPRSLSATLQNVLDKPLNNYTLNDIRKVVKSLPNTDWDSIRPINSSLNGQEWKRISEILVK